MNETDAEPHLSVRILRVVRERGPLTFTQIVHATQANRGSVWRQLKALRAHGHIRAVTLHGRMHYVARTG